MIRRTAYKGDTTRWALDKNKTVTYEFEFKKQLVKAGTQLKLKNDHSTYTFLCLVHDSVLDKTWLELSSNTGYYSKTIDRVSAVVGIKRSYKKKLTNAE